jgi:hypothetical protein
MQIEVEAINLGRRQALLSDGQIIPINLMVDHRGEDTDNPAEAVQISAGPDNTGGWWHGQVSGFIHPTKH